MKITIHDLINGGYFPTTVMQPPLPRIDHIDIKDAQCPKTIMGVNFHVTSLLGAAAVQKGLLGTQKFIFFKVAKFAV